MIDVLLRASLESAQNKQGRAANNKPNNQDAVARANGSSSAFDGSQVADKPLQPPRGTLGCLEHLNSAGPSV
jgi:hypothetical protein